MSSPRSVILLRSHADPALTRRRIAAWHAANPRSAIVFYDGTGGAMEIGDDPALNLVRYPHPRLHGYGCSIVFDAFRWIAERFPGAHCHYTEYDSVPLRAGYLDTLALPADVVLAGESDLESTDFRAWYEEYRVRAVEVVGRVWNVPVILSYGFGPTLILGAECVRYLGGFDEEDFERHLQPALERLGRSSPLWDGKGFFSFDEVITMSLLAGRGFRRVFNPHARHLVFGECTEDAYWEARAAGAFAVHAFKRALPWEADAVHVEGAGLRALRRLVEAESETVAAAGVGG